MEAVEAAVEVEVAEVEAEAVEEEAAVEAEALRQAWVLRPIDRRECRTAGRP